jgi:hypothetical protein
MTTWRAWFTRNETPSVEHKLVRHGTFIVCSRTTLLILMNGGNNLAKLEGKVSTVLAKAFIL